MGRLDARILLFFSSTVGVSNRPKRHRPRLSLARLPGRLGFSWRVGIEKRRHFSQNYLFFIVSDAELAVASVMLGDKTAKIHFFFSHR